MERSRTLPIFKIFGVNKKILSMRARTGVGGINDFQCITGQNKCVVLALKKKNPVYDLLRAPQTT